MTRKLIISSLTIFTFGVSIYLYVTNIKMIEPKYGTSEVILLTIPLTMVLLNIQLFFLPRFIKRRDIYSRFKKGIDDIFLSLTVILFMLHCGLLLLSMGTEFDLLRLLPILVGTVLITTANTLPRFQLDIIESSSPLMNSTNQVWNIILRPFSYPLFVGGLLMLLCGLLQGSLMLISFITIFIITLLISIFRAYKAYQLHLNEQ
ncbi:hypothetical protein AF332_26505 [Sporosarcina globispora]|uniref:Uncharacterized protein n=1 Tax=Sporosarcina globispora TaxID=1459 RepID=A0A0M0GJC6_SPOGL|nr:hypothetical protein [Sporosarcina globispora]KON90015.1 hypothetical protein AF332_26505 [Sporosarcina globispora]